MNKGKVKDLFSRASNEFNTIALFLILSTGISLVGSLGISILRNTNDIKIVVIYTSIVFLVSIGIVINKCLSLQTTFKEIGDQFGEE